MKFIPIIILSLFLQGCAVLDFFKRPSPPQIPPVTVIVIDSRTLEQCSLLPESLVIVGFEDAQAAYGTLASQYGACAAKQATSIKLIKKLGNLP